MSLTARNRLGITCGPAAVALQRRPYLNSSLKLNRPVGRPLRRPPRFRLKSYQPSMRRVGTTHPTFLVIRHTKLNISYILYSNSYILNFPHPHHILEISSWNESGRRDCAPRDLPPRHPNYASGRLVFSRTHFVRAGEGIRTLDINLGKVALYQLSYARD